MSSKPKLSPGNLINDRYQIVRCIGRGAVGQVFHAIDLHLDKQAIALKLLHPHLVSDKSILKRFHNEVFISRKLIHPNIVRVYDFESWDGGHLLSLEYVSGCDLAEICDAYPNRRLPYEEAVYILSQVASGLQCAHMNDVVHRDLKPHNIILDREGVSRITDFGLAFSLESSHALTRTGEVVGSPSYLAPEQFTQSNASKLSDIYSFGVICFELLTGQLPFQSKSYFGLGESHRTEAFPLEKLQAIHMPNKLRELICSCCEKNPKDRPSSIGEVRESLQNSRVEASEDLADGLRTMVHYRRKDAKVFQSKSWPALFYTFGIGVLLFGSYIILQDTNAQSRMLSDLHRVERVTGYSTLFLRELYPTNVEIDVTKDEDLKKFAHKELDDVLELYIAGNFDLLRPFNDGSGDTLVHYLARLPVQHHGMLLNKAYEVGVVDQRNKDGNTPLHEAIKAGNQNGLSALKNDGRADFSLLDGNNDTTLHLATASGAVESVKSVLFYGRGVSRTAWNHEGFNVLHMAVRSEALQILTVLLEADIQVDLRDYKGRTPLMLALSLESSPKSEKIVETLLRFGASTKAIANDGRDVFAIAEASERIVELKKALLKGSSSELN
jgi:serine/threonine protein kinase